MSSKRLVRETQSYLFRRLEQVQEAIDTVPVFSKRYNDACDEFEELQELLGLEESR